MCTRGNIATDFKISQLHANFDAQLCSNFDFSTFLPQTPLPHRQMHSCDLWVGEIANCNAAHASRGQAEEGSDHSFCLPPTFRDTGLFNFKITTGGRGWGSFFNQPTKGNDKLTSKADGQLFLLVPSFCSGVNFKK